MATPPCRENLFGEPAYAGCRASVFAAPPVSAAAGQALLIGLGVLFAAGVPLIAWLDRRHAAAPSGRSDFFSLGGRSMRLGLVSAVLCAQWIWSATLFLPPTDAITLGASGPFWYGATATVQLALMGVLVYQMRRLAPRARTVGEVVKARWGPWVHAGVVTFVVVQNLAVTALLLQTGGQQFEVLTGVPQTEFFFLVPLLGLPIVLGGLRGVMVNSLLKNALVFAAVAAIAIGVFCAGGGVAGLGSPAAVRARLLELAELKPEQPPILTFQRHDALVFGAVNFISGFALLFTEHNFFQFGLAARTRATNYAFFWGAVFWMALPWAVGTAAGLGALAVDMPLSPAELWDGTVLSGMADLLFGSAGSTLLAAALWAAISSGVAGEVIALASVVTHGERVVSGVV
jgi:Na+/proline symporter